MSKDAYTVKSHLQAHHGALSKFHKDMAAHHEAISQQHDKLAKLHDGDVADHHAAIAKAHQDAADTHEQFAGFQDDALELCASMTKAAGLPRDYIVPDRVSAFPREFSRVTAVPRAGQRQLDKTVVDTELDHIVEDIVPWI